MPEHYYQNQNLFINVYEAISIFDAIVIVCNDYNRSGDWNKEWIFEKLKCHWMIEQNSFFIWTEMNLNLFCWTNRQLLDWLRYNDNGEEDEEEEEEVENQLSFYYRYIHRFKS